MLGLSKKQIEKWDIMEIYGDQISYIMIIHYNHHSPSLTIMVSHILVLFRKIKRRYQHRNSDDIPTVYGIHNRAGQPPVTQRLGNG